jgi:hypothetical protein
MCVGLVLAVGVFSGKKGHIVTSGVQCNRIGDVSSVRQQCSRPSSETVRRLSDHIFASPLPWSGCTEIHDSAKAFAHLSRFVPA